MKKNSLIITIVIALTCIIAIGYAAFTSQLNITSTSTITSNWDIKITNATVKNINGGATSKAQPIISDTAVTFNTGLKTPGDSITYEVTVTNNGNVDAKVGTIEQTKTDNPAITFQTESINENDLLEAGQSQTFTVTIGYSDQITTQPENTEASYTIKLTYVQN